VNLSAGTSIADLDGTAETKKLVGTENEISIVKALSVLMLRAYKDRGPQVGIAGLTVTAVITDPQYSLLFFFIDKGISRLRGKTFLRV